MENLQGEPNKLNFIDFDGVFCDSLAECYVSSFIAYHQLYKGIVPLEVDLRSRERFNSYRPYIRRGGDYVSLQYAVFEDIRLKGQEDFDRLEEELGELSDEFHALFYEARRKILEEERSYWLSLNHIYPGLKEAGRGWAGNPACYILSTKEAPFIREILVSQGIDWPLERIICSGKRPKIEVIREVMAETGAAGASLFEDQIDHLYKLDDPRVRGYLAAWGYVKPEWLTQKDYPVIEREEMIRLIALISYPMAR